MMNNSLFLGYPAPISFREDLEKLSPAEQRLFLQEGDSPYLQIIECDGVAYLGKSLGASSEIGAVEGSASHICSLLKRLVPSHHYEENSLVLLIYSLPS